MHEPGALSYVVLDVPEPQASAVMSVRKQQGDLFRASLPVEITLTESFDPAQDPSDAFRALDGIAAVIGPIHTHFVAAHRFPGSDTFVMRLADEERFRALREQIVSVGLRFEPSRFAYVPHCTLRTRSPVTAEDARELLATEIPGALTLDTLSVYTLTRAATPAGVQFELRHQVHLAGSL